MKLRNLLLGLVLLSGVLASAPARSQEFKAGDLVITQPWSRAAPIGAELTSAYLTIENKGTAADRLVGASTDAAETVEIQKTTMSGGATSTEPVTGGLGISPGETVVLKTGAHKLALMKLKTQFKKGAKVAITLEFEKAGKVPVPFEVYGAGSSGPVAPKAATDSKTKK